MGNAEVQEAVYPLFLKHDKSEFIRSDSVWRQIEINEARIDLFMKSNWR